MSVEEYKNLLPNTAKLLKVNRTANPPDEMQLKVGDWIELELEEDDSTLTVIYDRDLL